MTWCLTDVLTVSEGQQVNAEIEGAHLRIKTISTDTRSLAAGALYVPLKGAHFDGHDFLAEAVAKGAVACLVSEKAWRSLAKKSQAAIAQSVPIILVEDTRLAYGLLAAWHRRQMPLKSLIGVTGSNGKTTTKALLANIIGQQASVLATAGNLNNDVGVPRTLLQLTSEHDYAVIEMGANHCHEIGYLTRLAQPDVAIITLAAGAHLEGFGSLEAVIETKGEIMDGLTPGGTLVLNTDSPGFPYWCDKAEQQALKIVTFGTAPTADIRLASFEQAESHLDFELRLADRVAHSAGLSTSAHSVKVSMPLLGQHNAMNAAAAVAACLAAGFRWEQIRPGLEDFNGVAGRLQRTALPQGWLIDDSYNANPNSVKAAIATLVQLPGESMVCLGAMAELGVDSESLHQEVAIYARQQGVRALLVFGEGAQSMVNAFGEGAEYFAHRDALTAQAVDWVMRQKVQNVLVKGSRSAGMEQVAQGLLAKLRSPTV